MIGIGRQYLLLTVTLIILLSANFLVLDTEAQKQWRQFTMTNADYSSDPIMTVLPFDAIPAITDPRFVEADQAKLDVNSPIIGVSLNGDSHAYSIRLLNDHEIVNDQVGDIPIATTW
jgi:hypothetical protein|tara:strand:+ start:494 stop:844 length:351 start_codon:yes stop_codon:yes gene_type:complete